ncbi:DUF1534 domain-containing protein, partial [Pseudomonas syringae]|nr:DUF1534 domain-containing protein [Pseudomonas syringae]
SFLTLQRGNAFHDALRHSGSKSAMPMRRMGMIGGRISRGRGVVTVHIVPHAPAWECLS